MIVSIQEFQKSILDLGAGCGLLCEADSLCTRIFLAMKRAEADATDSEELIHVTALALAQMKVDGIAEDWMLEQWNEASKYYHKYLCPDCRE